MEYILPLKITQKKTVCNEFHCLDSFLPYMDISPYYENLSCLSLKELNNLWNIFFIRWNRICVYLKQPNYLPVKKVTHWKEFDKKLIEFFQIKEDISPVCKVIFIMNLITLNLI